MERYISTKKSFKIIISNFQKKVLINASSGASLSEWFTDQCLTLSSTNLSRRFLLWEIAETCEKKGTVNKTSHTDAAFHQISRLVYWWSKKNYKMQIPSPVCISLVWSLCYNPSIEWSHGLLISIQSWKFNSTLFITEISPCTCILRIFKVKKCKTVFINTQPFANWSSSEMHASVYMY